MASTKNSASSHKRKKPDKSPAGVASPFSTGTAATVAGISEMPEQRFKTGADLLSLMLRTKVEQFVNADRTIFVCERKDRVIDVWRGLVKHNFQCVPVLQKTEHKHYGFLDLADIVRYVVTAFGEKSDGKPTTLSTASAETPMSVEAFWAQVEEEKVFGELTVDDLIVSPFRRDNHFHPVSKGYSLLHAVEALAREPGLQRVPIVSGDRHLMNMITQSQVVKFLFKHLSALGDKQHKPLSLCPSLFHPVVSVREEARAFDAFQLMKDNDVLGVAVVNAQDQLVGALSVRDMKLVGHDLRSFWRFYSSVRAYTDKLNEENRVHSERPAQVVAVTPQDTIGSALSKLATYNVHRVFICTPERKPIGLVSLKDILLEVISA